MRITHYNHITYRPCMCAELHNIGPGANSEFSTVFHTIIILQELYYAGTYDVQSAKAVGSNAVIITGQLITNSTARGLSLVLQSDPESPDIFSAVLRQDNNTPTVTSVMRNIPTSSYKVFIYDLEEDVLPNQNVAYELVETLTVTEESKCIYNDWMCFTLPYTPRFHF